MTGQVAIPSGDNICGSFLLRGSDPTYGLSPGASKTFTVRCAPRVLRPELTCDISTGPAPCAQIHCHAAIEPPESGGGCRGAFFPPDTLDFGSVPIGQTATRMLSASIYPDCPWPDARLDVIAEGGDFLAGDFSFSDGAYVRHVTLDQTYTWSPTLAFRPTVEGEETLALECFLVCGPPGSPGALCHTVMGKGVGVRTAAQGTWRRPAAWRARSGFSELPKLRRARRSCMPDGSKTGTRLFRCRH